MRAAHLSALLAIWLLSCGGARLTTERSHSRAQSPAPLPARSTQGAPATVASTQAPALELAQTASETPAPDAANGSVTDPPATELAQRFARMLSTGPRRAEPGLPAPHAANDNNPGNLVRSSEDLASTTTAFALSHDKRQLVFTRREAGASSIWIAAADGSAVRQLFDPKTDRVRLPGGKREVLASGALFDVRFSRDDRTLFFLTDGWATSLALYRLDLRNRTVTFVIDTNGYNVVEQCDLNPRLEGSIIAYRHSYDTLLATAFDVYFLVDAAGRDLGTLGPEQANVDRYLHNNCALSPPRAAPLVVIPPNLTAMPKCADGFLRYAPVHFLDGSELSVFYVVKPGHLHDRRLTLDNVTSPPINLSSLTEAFDEVCAQSP